MDVGYSVLIDGCDSTWRQLLNAACNAESAEDVDLAIAALVAESEWRKKQHSEAEAKQRADSDAPHHFASVSAEAMQAALDDVASWAGVAAEPAPDPDRE